MLDIELAQRGDVLQSVKAKVRSSTAALHAVEAETGYSVHAGELIMSHIRALFCSNPVTV